MRKMYAFEAPANLERNMFLSSRRPGKLILLTALFQLAEIQEYFLNNEKTPGLFLQL
jgi:hypothetical protein